MNPTHNALLCGAIGLACVGAIGGAFYFSHVKAPVVVTAKDPALHASSSPAFPAVSLTARAAYVYDVRSETALFSKNGETPLPLASMTKIMTAVVATTHIAPATHITISDTALATEGESGIAAGEQWRAEELVQFMLVISSNDAATALRETYEKQTGGSFIAAMNNQAKTLGLEHTVFVNETGLDEGYGKETNSGSSRDIARLLAHALTEFPRLFDRTRYEASTFTSLSGTEHIVQNTNLLANDIPWSMGAKTGFTDSAGGNLTIAFDISLGKPIVIVVMGSSKAERFTDVKKLIEATQQFVKSSR